MAVHFDLHTNYVGAAQEVAVIRALVLYRGQISRDYIRAVIDSYKNKFIMP